MEAIWQPYGRTDPKEAYCHECWVIKGGETPTARFPDFSKGTITIGGGDDDKLQIRFAPRDSTQPTLQVDYGDRFVFPEKTVRGTGPRHLSSTTNEDLEEKEGE
jgi:hypothetical protein